MTKTPPFLRPVLAILCCSAAITGTSPIWGIPGPVLVYQRPIDAMVDVTNDLGVAVLQDYAYTRSNFAFSPYGVVSVLVVLYEGARGESARQIHNVLRLPWNRDVTRIGFRDIHRHLRGYFSHEGYLSGLTLNKLNTSLLPEYRRVLRFYGYDVGLADEHGPFPPRKPTTTTTTTTTTSSPETEPQTPTIIQETTKPVSTTEQTTFTTLVSEETTTMETTKSEPSSTTTAPEETSPTIPVTVGDTSTNPTSGFTTIMDTSSLTTITETSPDGDTSTPVTTQDTQETSAPTTLTDTTKAEETPSTMQGPSTSSYPTTENPVEEAISTTTAPETSLPDQPVSSTLPSTLEQTTAVVENTDTTAMSTIDGESSTIEAATTKAAVLPTQPITSTVPTSLEEITTITEAGFTEDTSPVTESSTTKAEVSPTQPDTTTIPSSLPEVTTVEGTESGFTDTAVTSLVTESSADDATTKAEDFPAQPDTTTIPTSLPTVEGTESGFSDTAGTSLVTESPTDDATTKAVFPAQPDTTTIPTSLPEVTTVEGAESGVKDTLPTTVVDTSVTYDTETTAALLPEEPITSTIPTTLEDTTIMQTTTLTDEYTSPTANAESSTINAEARAAFLPEQPATSTVANVLKETTTIMDNTVPVSTGAVENTSTTDAETVPSTSTILEQITTAIENAELAAARLQSATTRPSSVVKKEASNIPMEIPLTTYSSPAHTGSVTSTVSVPEGTLSLLSTNSPSVAEDISSRAAKMLAPTNSSKVFHEGTSLNTEMPQEIAAATEDAMPPKDNFMLELASVFTQALGALKNESALEKTNIKRAAKVDMSAKEHVNSNSSSWDNTMTNTSHFGEIPSANHSRSRRAVAEERVVFFPDISLQLQNGMFDSQISRGYDLFGQLHRRPFLIDGATEELVPMMSYTAVFQYAYIHSLHAQALEFPLDDERYRLLILLPVEKRGLRQLIYDLNSCPLRTVFQALKPTRVQAIIPSFMVEGFVILTPTLQQLGVWDVFDPRRADLSGMSSDPELYVRNIEQAVTVVIRNYVKILDIQTRTLTARTMLQLFAATHPFLYFVVDTETHVSLMAGKMVDPLNSRIY